MKILIAPNSFKESLSSVKIAEIISKELSNEKNFQLTTLPLSDGGDGFLEVVKFIYKNEIIEHNFPIEFAGEKFNTPVLVNKSGKEIFIESAEVIGLKKLPQRKRNPLALNTFPLGKLINDLANNKYSDSIPEFEKIILGVGGTSTIDFGLGAVNALGIKFLDNYGREVEPIPSNFSLISEIIFPSSFSHPAIQSSNDSITPPIIHSNIQASIHSSLHCIVDVQTPLIGNNSAIDLYGPQKGAKKEELSSIKKGIEHIIDLMIKKNLITDVSLVNGAGGGLASGLKIFFDADIISANDFIFSNLFRDTSFDEFDYLITGEGKFDIQSFEGKATGEIIRKFSDKVKRIFLACGRIEHDVKKLIPGNVDCFELLDLYQDEEESKQKVAIGLKIISEKIRDRILK